ncbi:MAG TPA: NAD-dependent epimerase/dehydratase family protein, partial [Acetobacteraceae bacterium]|nr:NAD-dependent epimerase/dehydratase family protein [Acetobacteraceae bacterium]
RAIGAKRIRTHLSWADYQTANGAEWYRYLFETLGPDFEILPCAHYTPPAISRNGRSSGPPRRLLDFADFIDTIISAHGRWFDAIELWNEPNNLLDWDWRLDHDWVLFSEMLGAAAHWAQQRGKRVVLGAPCPTDLNWLRLMGERGILGVVDVVGLHGFPGTWDSKDAGLWPGWRELIAGARETIGRFRGDLEIWITETGYSTWRHDPAAQLDAFVEATKAPADRLYWYGLHDLPDDAVTQEGAHFDERHYHFGAFYADGREKLLGRLLKRGNLSAVHEVLASVQAAPAILRTRPVLITGGAGFIGSNLAERLASEGEHVLLYDGLARDGVEENISWLRRAHPRRVSAALGDIRDHRALAGFAAKASAVFHFAAQVAVTTSMDDPVDDFEINAGAIIHLVEALRRSNPEAPLLFASTNKVYGDLTGVGLEQGQSGWQPTDEQTRRYGVPEAQPLSFATPYGCSKGAADQYVLDYAASFGLRSCVLRMSCIYGYRQRGTEDQGWVAHFALQALRGKPITLYGDGHQVRDILFVSDAVATWAGAWRAIDRVSGQAFNLGGGPGNAVSLRRLVAELETVTGHPIEIRQDSWRPHDQRYFVADTRKLQSAIALDAPVPWQRGVRLLVEELSERLDLPEPLSARGVVVA